MQSDVISYIFQNSCYSKLEKADILEMTVRHLKNLKNQQVAGRFYCLGLFSFQLERKEIHLGMSSSILEWKVSFSDSL